MKKKTRGIFVKADANLMRMTDILRAKHSLNVSNFVRRSIEEAFERFEGGQRPKGENNG